MNALALLLALGPPPPPPPPESDPSPEATKVLGRDDPGGIETLDDPKDEPDEVDRNVEFATETPEPDEEATVEFSEGSADDASSEDPIEFAEGPSAEADEDELEYGEGDPLAAPRPEAVERQSTVDLASTTKVPSKDDPNYESPQRFAFEFKMGPYLPDVDRSFGDGLGPYAQIFGETNDQGIADEEPRKGLFTVFSFEYQFYDLGGPFSVGTSIGIFQDRAKALLANPTEETARSSADTVRFNVIPVTLLLGYRFELLADRFKVPLVPYVRGGLGYGFWWSRGANGNISTDSTGTKGRGGSWGWQVNLGGMLRLDWLERASSLDLDRVTGINHTYLFGEYQFSRLDGFSGGQVSVGDDTFLVGFAIEF